MTRKNNANYLMMSVHSNDQTGMKRISTNVKNSIRSSYVGLCGTRVIGPLEMKMFRISEVNVWNMTVRISFRTNENAFRICYDASPK